MLALEQARSPGHDGGEGPLAEVGYGSRGDRRAPKELGDILDAPDGGPGQAHLHDGLLNARFAPAAALDHDRLEGRAARLGALGSTSPLVVTGSLL